ncbi:LIC_10705 family lipoprotein [Leptospira stimsonii]|uniref:Lipoprotein n=1 Tax=Leptospira stimsonii TaxID=2202203 RepID=A0A396Z7P4_9LEPT|nr:LIC_10705 family lipoprotein [Leptospira stimsonii]RHX89140.1 hypothetical protein DLM75_14895 [Leptospira stimsonii]
MLKKMMVLTFTCWLAFHCNGEFENSNKGKTNGINNDQFIFYTLFFVVPDLDFNQFCPPTDQIPILEPGTYTRFMKAGDTYIFDNRARLSTPKDKNSSSTRFFTFTIQENPGQEIKLVTPKCGNSPIEFAANNDSNLSGQLETVFIDLETPPLPKQRSNFFTKLTAVSGSGTITFTTPSLADSLNAH